MTELLVVLLAAFVVIAAATLVGPRLGIASPLVLVAIGVGASFLPVFASTDIDPELILQGVLPPLLYASAVSMPAMNFRREFFAISGLSVVLVIASSLVLGVLFMFVIPGVGFGWGVALGAIISPTDAVATTIIKRTSVSKRCIAVLDGESLLNDATALVILRTAIAATALGFSFWGSVGTFGYSVLIAVVIGGAIGGLNLLVRKRVTDSTVNTVLSFAVPFAASVPTAFLGASGLVAAVVAGLITGLFAPRYLSPQNRLSDAQNWGTVELVLQGAVFLTMGVQIRTIVMDVEQDHAGAWTAVLIAIGALAVTLVVRALYVAPLLRVLRAYADRGAQLQPRLESMQEKLVTREGTQESYDEFKRRPGRKATEQDLDRFALRVTRGLADLRYFLRQPLGWREGTVVVWAGMRGAVTVAAAQTLPSDTPQRPVLVLVAFAVAALSLLVQGGTVGWLVRWIMPADDPHAKEERASEVQRILGLMRESSDAVPEPPRIDGDPSQEQFEAAKKYRLAAITAQRSALLNARDNGTFDADLLERALANLDASQIALEMRGSLAV